MRHDDVRIISCQSLQHLLNTDQAPLLLDPLTQNRFKQVHLPGAQNACVFEMTFVDQVAALAVDKLQPLVIYGASDGTQDAITAAKKLLRAGYTDVKILQGGLAAWQHAGLPVEGEAPEPTSSALSPLTDGPYSVDLEESHIEWTGRNIGSSHWGSLRLAQGRIAIEGGDITGDFVIDMNTIDNDDLAGDELKPVLEAHLKSDDFFFVDQFPQARFSMKAQPTHSAIPVSAPNYEVSGQLTLCGVEAELRFPATISGKKDGSLAVEAHFDFDRTRWGVIYGSTRFFEHLGMHLVFDNISIQLRLVANPA